jgi:hypothetical protein
MNEKTITQMFVAQAMSDIPTTCTRVRASVRLTKARETAHVSQQMLGTIL